MAYAYDPQQSLPMNLQIAGILAEQGTMQQDKFNSNFIGAIETAFARAGAQGYGGQQAFDLIANADPSRAQADPIGYANELLGQVGVPGFSSAQEWVAASKALPGHNEGLGTPLDAIVGDTGLFDVAGELIDEPGVQALLAAGAGGAAMGGGAGATTAAGSDSLAGNIGSTLDPSFGYDAFAANDPLGVALQNSYQYGVPGEIGTAAEMAGFPSVEAYLEAVNPAWATGAVPTTAAPSPAPADLALEPGAVTLPTAAIAGGAVAPSAATGGAAATTGTLAAGAPTGWETLRNQLGLSAAISGVLGSINTPSQGEEARLARASDHARGQVAANNRRRVQEAFAGFDDRYFDSIADAFQQYYEPQVSEDFDTLERETIYAAPGGVGSSAFAGRLGKVAEGRQKALTAVGSEAFNESERARSDVEGQRASLLGLAESSEDSGAFGEQAVAAASAAARPPDYSPLADLMARYGNMLTDVGESQRGGFRSPRPLTRPLMFGGSGGGGGSSVKTIP